MDVLSNPKQTSKLIMLLKEMLLIEMSNLKIEKSKTW